MSTIFQSLTALPTAEFGTSGITKWLQENVVTVLILLLALCVLWAARGGHIGKGITIAAGAVVGLVMLGLATGTNAADLGNWIVSLIKE